MKIWQIILTLGITISFVWSLESCRTRVIKMPAELNGYPQPLTKTLKFSSSKILNWVEMNSKLHAPIIKNLDIDKLPDKPYDTLDFKSFEKSPDVKAFHFDSFPSNPFLLEKLISNKIQFRNYVLAAPVLIKSIPLAIEKTKRIALFDFIQLDGFDGKFPSYIYKDSNGLIWIATEKGLSRYDGEHFLEYTISFIHDIRCMTEDKEGKIWCVARDGIAVLDLKNGIVKTSDQIKTNNTGGTEMIQ